MKQGPASPLRFERYVALGDSTVEGLDDPYPDGRGYRGWADRLAAIIAERQGSVLYANLAIRGRTTRRIREEQLAPALAMRPDLALLVCGTNDLLRRRFDPARLRDDIQTMQSELRRTATVLTFTMPDLSSVMPVARLVRERLLTMNSIIRGASAITGTIVADFERHAVTSDPRLWSDDRLHANSAGHERIAAALAYHLGLEGTDATWADPFPGDRPGGARYLVTSELAWVRRHLLPWLWRHARGRSSGDGITPKRPQLTKVVFE